LKGLTTIELLRHEFLMRIKFSARHFLGERGVQEGCYKHQTDNLGSKKQLQADQRRLPNLTASRSAQIGALMRDRSRQVSWKAQATSRASRDSRASAAASPTEGRKWFAGQRGKQLHKWWLLIGQADSQRAVGFFAWIDRSDRTI